LDAVSLFTVNAMRADPTGWAAKLGVNLASGENVVRAPLVFDEALMAAAQGHSLQMFDAGILAHSGNGFGTMSERAEAAGYASNAYLGENIYKESGGYDNLAGIATRAAEAWFKSAGHRANILGKNYVDFGVSFAHATPEQSDDDRYATQMFGQAWGASKTYLSGFIFSDADADAFYDAGEGVSDVTLVVSTTGANPTSAVVPVSTSGYWFMEAEAGIYDIQVQSGQRVHQLDDVTVDSSNRSINFITGTQAFYLDYQAASGTTPGLVAVVDSFTVDEDGTTGPLDLLSNDLNESDTALSLASVADVTLTPGSAQTIAVTQGAVNVSTSGDITFTPAPNYHGPVTFSYAVANGDGAMATGTVNGTVLPSEDEATGTLRVSGKPEPGRSLTALLSGATDPDGPITNISYRWQQNTGSAESPVWSERSDSASATIAIAADDALIGQQLRALATTTDALGGTSDLVGEPVTIVSASAPSNPQVAPSPRQLKFGQVIDTWIDINNPTTSYGSAASLDIDLSSSNGPKEQTLLRFVDLFGDGKGQIRPDDTIVSASLGLYSEGYSGNGLEAYVMLQDWAATDTWSSLGNGVQTDGIEATGTPGATLGPYESWGGISIDVTSSVQGWLDAPHSNFGWMITASDSDGGRFGASETANGDRRPFLLVNVERPAALVSISAADPFAFEGTSTGAFTVSRNGTVGDLVVPYVISGTATAGTDFTPLSGSVTIADGRSSATITVIPLADGVAEGPETVTLTIEESDTIETDLAQATITLRDQFMGTGGEVVPLDQTFQLHSLPGARHTLYLDFLGSNRSWDRWNEGNPVITPTFDTDGDPTTFSDAERILIQRTWAETAEDFRPFNINVTTELPADGKLTKTDPTDQEWGIRAILGDPSNWEPGATGKAVLNSFTAAVETPAWIQTTSKHMAVFISHEVGHAMGLDHDGRGSTEYYEGHGSGETSWGPLMGGALAGQVSQWSDGDYPNATNKEDDLLIITTQNGFGYRTDDHGDNLAQASPMITFGDGSQFQFAEGVIESTADVDWFSFSVGDGKFDLDITPLQDFANLDVRLDLFDANETLIATDDPVNQLDASLTTSLPAGNYFLRVQGVGNPDPGSDGYNDYGSLGFYTARVGPAATTLTFQQGVNGYDGTSDTYIGRDFTSAKGHETTLKVDGKYNNYSGSSLIRFDNILWGEAGITKGALIQSAELDLNVTNTGEAFTVHQMLRDWSESDTYASLGDGITADGTEAASQALGTFESSVFGWQTLDITGAINTWLADPASNFGLLLRPVAGISNGIDFDSSESANAPKLTVKFWTGDATETTTLSIKGNATQGQTLTADTSAIADADGLGSGGFSYQWQANGTNIAGATGSTYALTQAEVGKTVTVVVSYTDGGGTAESLTSSATAAVKNINGAPTALSISSSSFNKNIAAGTAVAILSTTDPDSDDTFSYSLVTGNGDRDNSAFSINGNQLIVNAAPDFERQTSYSIRLRSTDQGGLSTETDVTLSVNDLPESVPQTIEIAIPAQSIQVGQSIAIPININDADGVESLDLNLTYDPAVFSAPQAGALITAGTLNPGAAFVVNDSPAGQLSLSWAGTSPLSSGSGSIATLNLEVRPDASPGTTTLLDLRSASVNEDQIGATLSDGTITIRPPSFQVLDVRHMPNGLALLLSEAPDLDLFNLYDGPDSSLDAPDLALTNASGQTIALSAHWQESNKELQLLSLLPLAAGDYTLTIDSRSDGLISASSGELLDGNGDGTAGDAYSYAFTQTAAEHSLSIADTARGAGQALGVNGTGTHDPVTGQPIAAATGLPIHLSTTAALTSLSGSLSFDSSLLLADALTAGADLPDDWTLNVDPNSPAGKLLYSATGSTAITGDDQEILRFQAIVAAAAAPPERGTTGNGLYGSTALINATLSSDQLTGEAIRIDPGLVALAYSGDTTGNGTLSSLDASRVQRVVVGLDSGFDAYDTINPVLIGDTTGNGSLSSLDASRIQQQVVGLPVNSFPDLPESPIVDPIG